MPDRRIGGEQLPDDHSQPLAELLDNPLSQSTVTFLQLLVTEMFVLERSGLGLIDLLGQHRTQFYDPVDMATGIG